MRLSTNWRTLGALLLTTAGLACTGSKNGAAGAGGANAAGASSVGGQTQGGNGAGGSSANGIDVGASVLQHHKNATRDGVYVDGKVTLASAANYALDSTFNGTVSGNVYAQPLYVASTDASKPDLVVVATEQNQVYALDASSGSPVWNRTLPAPVPRNNLPCGNIDPLGVTGTPIIDPATRIIYLDAMTNPASPKHMLYALSLDTGADVPGGWPVDVGAAAKSGSTSFTSNVQNQRGALALVNGTVYVPYGGHYGDCGSYHGWVVGVSTADPTHVTAWATAAAAGGTWAPSGIATDGKALFISTGNTMGASTWGGGEAVIRLGLDLTFSNQAADYFSPTNWQSLDNSDSDIGGTGPIVFSMAGATPSALTIALGKDRNAYLINRDSFGGVGGQIVSRAVSSSQIIQAAVAYSISAGTFVAFKGSGSGCPTGTSGNLTALKITAGSPPTFAVNWCAHTQGNSSPSVSMSDASGTDAIVWQVGNDAHLRGFNAATGAAVFSGGASSDVVGNYSPFQPPVIAKGRIFFGAFGKVVAFASR